MSPPAGTERVVHSIRTFIRTFCPDSRYLPSRLALKDESIYPDIYPDILSGCALDF